MLLYMSGAFELYKYGIINHNYVKCLNKHGVQQNIPEFILLKKTLLDIQEGGMLLLGFDRGYLFI